MLRERRPLIHDRVPPKAGSCEPPAPSAETLAPGFFLLQCMRNGGQRFRRDFNMIFRSAPGCRLFGSYFLWRMLCVLVMGNTANRRSGWIPHRAEKCGGSIVSRAQISTFRSFLVSGRPASYIGMICCRVQTLNKVDDNRARKSRSTAKMWSPGGVQTQPFGALASNWRPNLAGLSLVFSVNVVCK
jgi:hypothetical protein